MSYSYLFPLFNVHGVVLALPALYTLAITGASVGLALGTLLPYPGPGACLGFSIALLFGAYLPKNPLFFPIFGSLLAILGAYASMT